MQTRSRAKGSESESLVVTGGPVDDHSETESVAERCRKRRRRESVDFDDQEAEEGTYRHRSGHDVDEDDGHRHVKRRREDRKSTGSDADEAAADDELVARIRRRRRDAHVDRAPTREPSGRSRRTRRAVDVRPHADQAADEGDESDSDYRPSDGEDQSDNASSGRGDGDSDSGSGTDSEGDGRGDGDSGGEGSLLNWLLRSKRDDSRRHSADMRKLKKHPDLLKQLKEVEKLVEESNPTLMQILQLSVPPSDKIKMYEVWRIFRDASPDTEDRLSLKYSLKALLESAGETSKGFSATDATFVKDEVARLEREIPQLPLKVRILKLQANLANKSAIYRKYKEYESLGTSGSEEGPKLRQWLNVAVSLPHDIIKTPSVDPLHITEFLHKTRRVMDAELFGMEPVKQQILLYLHLKLTQPLHRGLTLGLLGLPGTGKTKICKLIARLLDLPFETIAFGGCSSSAEFLKGFDACYLGSQPGEIVRCLTRMACKNGVLLMDELDKVIHVKEINAALLHITDPNQNDSFQDVYLAELKIDLSRLWLVFSMNQPPEDPALRDRLFIVKVPGYTFQDKVTIATKYLLPNALKDLQMPPDSVTMDGDACKHLVARVNTCNGDVGGGVSGVRPLERALRDIVLKVQFLAQHGNGDVSASTSSRCSSSGSGSSSAMTSSTSSSSSSSSGTTVKAGPKTKTIAAGFRLLDVSIAGHVQLPMRLSPVLIDMLYKMDADEGTGHLGMYS